MLIEELIRMMTARDVAIDESWNPLLVSRWKEACRELISLGSLDPEFSERFHTEWFIRGHRIRELVADDELMCNTLWACLPPYQGSSLDLYRGESIERWNRGQLGFGWSQSKEVAIMFASGLNSLYGAGGVLLHTFAHFDAIVAGPNHHSKWLMENEYVVDKRRLGRIIEIEEFPRRE